MTVTLILLGLFGVAVVTGRWAFRRDWTKYMETRLERSKQNGWTV